MDTIAEIFERILTAWAYLSIGGVGWLVWQAGRFASEGRR